MVQSDSRVLPGMSGDYSVERDGTVRSRRSGQSLRPYIRDGEWVVSVSVAIPLQELVHRAWWLDGYTDEDGTIYREIPGHTGYHVAEDGRVMGLRGTLLKPRLGANGYWQVAAPRMIEVHRLVALAWIGQPPTPRHEVRHLDGSKTNNDCSNLAWGTRAENRADDTRLGAERRHMTPEQVEQIAIDLTAGHSYRTVIRDHKCTYTSVYRIAHGLHTHQVAGLCPVPAKAA